MHCPDDALLDRWLDEALTSPEAAALSSHVAACPACAARWATRLAEEQRWHAAVALDTAELDYLRRADLAAAWRQAAAAARPALWWPALTLLALAGAATAWLLALPNFELLIEVANRLGVLGLALAWAWAQAWRLGVAALDVLVAPPIVNPAAAVAMVATALWLLICRPWTFPAVQNRVDA